MVSVVYCKELRFSVVAYMCSGHRENGSEAQCLPTAVPLKKGGHIRAEIKFPVFALSFPCVTNFFPVFFPIKLIDGFE